jgi:hypothetical protein
MSVRRIATCFVLAGACADGDAMGVCVTTHESLADHRHAATRGECEDYCASTGGYVCCYFDPDEGPWIALEGEC